MTLFQPPEKLRPQHGKASLTVTVALPPLRQRIAYPDQNGIAHRAKLKVTKRRLAVAIAGFISLFGAAAGKLAYVSVLAPVEARRVPASTTLATLGGSSVASPRGTITDRNGEILAVTLPISALYANPQEITDPEATAKRLAEVLPQLDRNRVLARLMPDPEGKRQFVYLSRSLTPREVLAVNATGLVGIYFEHAERRYYPQGRSAVHVLGGVDVDGRGIAGVEKYLDSRLRTAGETLRLSLDTRVQLALRDSVEKAISDYNGIGGAGIVLDVKTGEVLAMASLPDYDANDVGAATPDQRFNRATVGVFEPGSTFKLLTAAMALDAGTANLSNSFDASRPIRYGRFTISDYKGKDRWLSFPEVLAYSSNLGAAHMALTVGLKGHRDFLVRLGMASRLKLELPETAVPLIPRPQAWHDINTMTIAFGHGIAVSPMHVVTGIAAITNGGIFRQPTLLAQAPGAELEGTRVVSERTSDTMRRLMRLVVTDGSGKGAEVSGYFVGGKTGTAQKTGPKGGYLENKRIAAFVGAFPMNAPRYAVYVMVDEPKPNARSHGYATAGWVAAPAAGQVVTRIAPVLNMIPETERHAQIQSTIALPMPPGRASSAATMAPMTRKTTAAGEPPPPPPKKKR